MALSGKIVISCVCFNIPLVLTCGSVVFDKFIFLCLSEFHGVAISFLDFFPDFLNFLHVFTIFRISSRFLKAHHFLTIFCSKLVLSLKRCFSIYWMYWKDTVLLFELCCILFQPVLTFWINFFKVLLIWLFKSLYVDIT